MKSVRNLGNKTNKRTKLLTKSKKKIKSIQRTTPVFECPFCMKKFPNIKQHIGNMHPDTEKNQNPIPKSKQGKEMPAKNKKSKKLSNPIQHEKVHHYLLFYRSKKIHHSLPNNSSRVIFL